MATNVVKTTFIGDTAPIEKSVEDYKRSLADLRGEIAKTDEAASNIGRAAPNGARLNAYRQELGQSYAAAAKNAGEIQTQLQGGSAALLRSVGLSDNLSTKLGAAASQMVVTKAAAEGTAAALTEANAATVLISSGLAAAAIGLAAGVVSILAVKKATDDIREAAEKRLAAEIKITAEWNKQHQILAESNARPLREATDREFDRLANSNSGYLISRRLEELQNQRAPLALEINRTGQGTESQFKQLSALDDQISKLNASYEELNRTQGKKDSDRNWEIEKLQFKARYDAIADQAKAQQKADDAAKKAAEEMQKRLEEIQKAKETLFDSAFKAEGKDNPFVAFLGTANKEMRTMLETAKVLSPALQKAFQAQLQIRNQDDRYKLRLDTQLDVDSLRRQAAEFRQGYRNDLSDPQVVQRLLDEQLKTLGLGGRRLSSATYAFGPAGIGRYLGDIGDTSLQAAATEKQKAYRDQRLLNLAGGLDPAQLTRDQQSAIASAFEREANRKLDYEKNANDFFTSFLPLITKNGLKVDLAGAVVDLNINNATGGNAVVRTSQGTNRRSTAQAMGLPVSLNTGTLGT